MLMVTPPYRSSCPPTYCFIRPPGCHPSSPMYVVDVLAWPSQRAIQIWSGRWYAVGVFTRAWSSIQMPEPALE